MNEDEIEIFFSEKNKKIALMIHEKFMDNIAIILKEKEIKSIDILASIQMAISLTIAATIKTFSIKNHDNFLEMIFKITDDMLKNMGSFDFERIYIKKPH